MQTAPNKTEIIEIIDSGLATSIIPNKIKISDVTISVQPYFFKNFFHINLYFLPFLFILTIS